MHHYVLPLGIKSSLLIQSKSSAALASAHYREQWASASAVSFKPPASSLRPPPPLKFKGELKEDAKMKDKHTYPSPLSTTSQKLFTLLSNHAAHLSFQYRPECAEWTQQSAPSNENIHSCSSSWKEAPLGDGGSLIEMLLNVHRAINAGREAFGETRGSKTMVPCVCQWFNMDVGSGSSPLKCEIFPFCVLFRRNWRRNVAFKRMTLE